MNGLGSDLEGSKYKKKLIGSYLYTVNQDIRSDS